MGIKNSVILQNNNEKYKSENTEFILEFMFGGRIFLLNSR